MRLGLVHAVSDLDGLGNKAAQLAAELHAGKREAQRAAKLLIEDVRLAPANQALVEDTARRLAEIRATPEAQEAFSEFLKR